MRPRLKIHSGGDFALLLIVVPFSLYVSAATGDSAIVVNNAAMKLGENRDVKQAAAIKHQNGAESGIPFANEHIVKDNPGSL